MPKRFTGKRPSPAVIDQCVHVSAQLLVLTLLVACVLAGADLLALSAVALAAVVRILERRLARSREEADLDPLTGSLNRAAFSRVASARLECARGESPWGVVMIDLDNFGALNKSRGHLAGDWLLRDAARRVKLAVEPAGFMGRLGGDEFAALVPASHAELVARKALATLLAGPEPISASIGVAATCAAGCEWVAVLREADVALRVAKRQGKGRVVLFTEGIEGEEHFNRRRVREAIDDDRIDIAVQPIVDLTSGRIHAYEALARFRGSWPASPAHWLSVADSLGMRVELELACLQRSLRLLEELPDGASLSVNLSALALHDPRARRLLLSGRPERLIVEVTEEGLVKDLRGLRADLDPLLSSGIKLAVDDMGAGYSNLRQVVELAPSLLKLDRTLVHGIDADPAKTVLIDALTGYAQRTGAQIVAEGIETESELDVLGRLGITYGQGYLLARPGQPWPQVSLRLREAVGAGGTLNGTGPSRSH